MSNVGVTVRTSPTERSYYRFQIVGSNSALLDGYIGGVYTGSLGAITVPPGGFAAGDVIRLEVSGSTLTALVNGSVVGTATDTNLTGGFPGVRFANGNPEGRLDDWEGGDLY